MFLAVSSSTVHEVFGKRTFYGYHSCANKKVTCGHVCSSFSVGVLVVTPSIVTLEDNGSIKSFPYVATKMGILQKYCLGLLSHMHAIFQGLPGCDPWFHPSRLFCWVLGSWYSLSQDCRMLWLPKLLALPLWSRTRQFMAQCHIICQQNAWRCSWIRKNCLHMRIQIHSAVEHWSLALDRYLPLLRLKSRDIAPRCWINPRGAPQSAIVSCCVSRCDK